MKEYRSRDYAFARTITHGIKPEKSAPIEPLWHSWLAGAFIVLGFMVPVIILTLSSGK